MIEKFMRDHPLVSFVVVPCAVIALALLFMGLVISFINSGVAPDISCELGSIKHCNGLTLS